MRLLNGHNQILVKRSDRLERLRAPCNSRTWDTRDVAYAAPDSSGRRRFVGRAARHEPGVCRGVLLSDDVLD